MLGGLMFEEDVCRIIVVMVFVCGGIFLGREFVVDDDWMLEGDDI